MVSTASVPDPLSSSVSAKHLKDSSGGDLTCSMPYSPTMMLCMQRTASSDNHAQICHTHLQTSGNKGKELQSPLLESEDTMTTHTRHDRASKACSWSSTCSSFSSLSTSTSSTTPTSFPYHAAASSDISMLPIPDGMGDAMDTHEDTNEMAGPLDEQMQQERHPQRRWQRRISQSLCRASSNGDVVTVQHLLHDDRLRPFVDVNAPDDEQDGTTPIIYASCFGKADVVRMLLDAGARADSQDKIGWTALMWATTNNHSDVVALLLEHGASSDARSAQGRTALDFIDTGNEKMVTIMQRRDSSCVQRLRARRRSSVRSVDDNEAHRSTIGDPERRPQHMETVTEQHDNALGDADNDHPANHAEDNDHKPTSEAQLPTSDSFVWDHCRHDQMLVFSQNNADHILDTVITQLKLPMKSRQEIWVPANAVFLCARFAHYFSSRELLHDFLTAATERMGRVIKSHYTDIHVLAYWMTNLFQLLHYLKKDAGLVVATAEHQLCLSELISEAYTLLVHDSMRRIECILEPALLEHEPIQGLEAVDFADDWHRFFRRRSTRRSSDVTSGLPTSPTSETHPAHVIRPQSITSLLTSILYVLRSYEVHPSIVVQAMAQFFHFLSSETFNRILAHKKYLCRSRALQIRMNLTVVEEWAREQALPNMTCYLSPLVQLLQLLQCLSQLNDLSLFIPTVKSLDLMNPLQIKRCVHNYRYEVTEPRLPDEIEKYCLQAVQDAVRSMKRPSCTFDHDAAGSQSPHTCRSSSRPTSVSSLGSIFSPSRKDSKRGSVQSQLSNTSVESEDAERDTIATVVLADDNDVWDGTPVVVEKRDSKYMLPFSLPNTAVSHHDLSAVPLPPPPPSSLTPATNSCTHRLCAAAEPHVPDSSCQELQQKRVWAAREYLVIPTIPEDWMCLLDKKQDTIATTHHDHDHDHSYQAL